MPWSISFEQAVHAIAVFGGAAQAPLQPRQVHLRGREDATQLVVQLAREARLLAFGIGLEECR
jgi:hypothetical protein